jgi:DNA-binding transcriptional MocR family regulator
LVGQSLAIRRAIRLIEEACAKFRPKALYCMPTVQNPTGSIMSEQRRHQIAEIARRNNVATIEDDTYGFLAPDAPAPITVQVPRLGYYITTLLKSVAPGVRIGYMVCPTPRCLQCRTQ